MGEEVQLGISESLSESFTASQACGVCCLCFLLIVCIAYVLIWFVWEIMNFVGLWKTFWLTFDLCSDQVLLRWWLVLLQTLCLFEVVFNSYCCASLQAAIREHRCGNLCHCVFVLSTFVLKILWCCHSWTLINEAPFSRCAQSLPWFMYWFTWSFFLQITVVVPLTQLCASVLMWAARNGLLTTNRGAKPGTLENLEVLTYDPATFADPNCSEDARPTGECCICLKEYDAETAIVRTPCNHIMHKDCLGKWLQASRHCPLCRQDLEEGGGEEA